MSQHRARLSTRLPWTEKKADWRESYKIIFFKQLYKVLKIVSACTYPQYNRCRIAGQYNLVGSKALVRADVSL